MNEKFRWFVYVYMVHVDEFSWFAENVQEFQKRGFPSFRSSLFCLQFVILLPHVGFQISFWDFPFEFVIFAD